MEKEIQNLTEQIQRECQQIVDATFKPNPKESAVNTQLQYQDCMNVAIFMRLAELQFKINQQH